MEQKQNSTGEGENLRCGVSTVGVRSGPTGWSQDPQHEDRPCMGPRVVALWDTAACPGHKGAVWGLCGGCVGAVPHALLSHAPSVGGSDACPSPRPAPNAEVAPGSCNTPQCLWGQRRVTPLFPWGGGGVAWGLQHQWIGVGEGECIQSQDMGWDGVSP